MDYEVRTKRALIATVAERWKEQYWSPRGWKFTHAGPNRMAIYKRLVALSPNATEADVIEAMGLGSRNGWIENRCDHCDRDVDVTVRLGDEPDDESSTAYVCRECLVGALAAMDEGAL